MVELEAVDLAEVVAVELVRERRLVLDDEVVEVDLLVEVRRVGSTPPPRSAPASERRIAVACIVRNVTATSPRSSVAACERSSGRLPRYVYGLVLSTIEK